MKPNVALSFKVLIKFGVSVPCWLLFHVLYDFILFYFDVSHPNQDF